MSCSMKLQSAPKCVVCKTGEVVAQIDIIPDPNPIIGGDPGFPSACITFHCDNPLCQLAYNLPPGCPDARKEVHSRRLEQFEEERFKHF